MKNCTASTSKKIFLATCFVTALCHMGRASIQSVTGFRQEGDTVILNAGKATFRITILTEDICRFQATDKTVFQPSLMVKSGFVKTDWPAYDYKLKDSTRTLEISTARLKIEVTKSPLALEILSADGASLLKTVPEAGIALDSGAVMKLEMTPRDHFFGFGYMRKCFDARGNTLVWTRGYRNNEATVPFYLNPRGYAFYSNNTWKHCFDFTHDNYFSVTTDGGDLDFFVMTGPDFRTLLDHYTALTGRPQMAPKWGLGLEYRARYMDEQQTVLDSARKFRQCNVPCEVIALEPGWEKAPYSMKWEWSSERFPDYLGMIKELKSMGYKFDLWESGVAPKKDFLNPEVRKQWFAQRINALTKWGVDMFKQDDPYPRDIDSVGMEPMIKSKAEVEDIAYQPGELLTVGNTFYSQTVFDEFRRITGRRPIIQFHSYNASVASQRWPYEWAGDFRTGWGLFNASLSGHSMVNADANDPGLEGRHLGFFMSACGVIDCWASYTEPWNYSDRLLEGCRMYASLRSRLYPYLYTALRVAHETGTPILRPLVLLYPDDPQTYNIGSEFFLGDHILVAAAGSNVFLPKGTWTDYWTGKDYTVASNQWVSCAFPAYAGGPLLVQAGAVIPLAQVKQFTTERPDELLVLDAYPGGREVSNRLYEDDGETFKYEQGQFANTTFSCIQHEGTIRIQLGRRIGSFEGMTATRDYLLKVHSSLAPSAVTVDGKSLEKQPKALVLFSAGQAGWYYDAEAGKIIIKPHSGWRFADSTQDPAGTYPLTSKEETVIFEKTSDYSALPSTVTIALDPNPARRLGQPDAIRLTPENSRVQADGHSQVPIAVAIVDRDGNVVTNADAELKVSLNGGGVVADHARLRNGVARLTFTSPTRTGESQITAQGAGLHKAAATIGVAGGHLELLLIPKQKIRMPGKGEWLGKHLGIAVSVRDDQGNRLACQDEVHLTLDDSKGRESITNSALLINGEAEFNEIGYHTRPEKFLITATAASFAPVQCRAFTNTWELPDDYMTNAAIKAGLDEVLKH
jgi:alpha-glucosidase (family GH31 glycosyl hydrolase)